MLLLEPSREKTCLRGSTRSDTNRAGQLKASEFGYRK